MRAKKMATAKRSLQKRRSPVLLNVREHFGITWVWGGDVIYHPHWRNAGRMPTARIFYDHKGGRILLVDGVCKGTFSGKNADGRAFRKAASFVQMRVLRD